MRPALSFLFACIACFLAGCGDEFMTDPAMTANINGRDFTACTNLEGKFPTPTLPKDNLKVTYDPATGHLNIRGTDSCNDSVKSIHLDIKDVYGAGRYQIDQQSSLYYNPDDTPGSGAGNNGALQYLGRHPANSAGIFTTDPQHVGVLTITAFNLEERRLSGDFEMEVFGAPSNRVFRIREGKLRDVAF